MAATHQSANLHERAMELYEEGKRNQAEQLFSKAIERNQTSELWNDWTAVRARLGQTGGYGEGIPARVASESVGCPSSCKLGSIIALTQKSCRSRVVSEEGSRRCKGTTGDRVANSHRQMCRGPESGSGKGSAGRTPAQGGELRNPTEQTKKEFPSRGVEPGSRYEHWFAAVFGQRVAAAGTRLAVS